MLGLKSILLLALSVSTLCDITDKDSLIYKILQGFAKQAPELEKEVQKPETYPTSEIRQIVSRGFTYYKESSAAVQYSGVEAANLDAFLSYIQDIIKLPAKYQSKFIKTMKLVKFAKFSEIVSTDIGFSVDGKSNDCKYVNVMGQKNKDGTFDFLLGEINATFKFAPDLLIIVSKESSSWFGLSHTYEEQIVENPHTITKDQLTKLFTYFEIIIFKQFSEVLDMMKNLH